MKDLFEKEQKVLDEATARLAEIRAGGPPCRTEELAVLTGAYANVLKQLRRITRISDRTTVNLNTHKLDLMDQVHYDSLTGIYNRRYLEENLGRVIKTLARSGGGKMSVLMLDIDFFKKYNDTYGHARGDKCLKIVAEALRQATGRAGDFVARYGGEEFVAVLPNTAEEGARLMAERFLEAVRALRIPHTASEVADWVTISVGATSSDIWGSRPGDAYLKRADEALYLSKKNGRDRYTYVDFEEHQ